MGCCLPKLKVVSLSITKNSAAGNPFLTRTPITDSSGRPRSASSRAVRDEVIEAAERRFGGWGGLVAGTPSEVAEALNREVDLGVEMFICQFSDFASPKSLRLFAREVLPALRAPLTRAC